MSAVRCDLNRGGCLSRNAGNGCHNKSARACRPKSHARLARPKTPTTREGHRPEY